MRTEKQEKFLEVLFESAGGDFRAAARLAGYSDSTPIKAIVTPLKTEIAELTSEHMAINGAKALTKLLYVLDNPGTLGNKDLIAAAKELLDRGGFGKKEQLEIKTESPLFILPPKDNDVETS